MPDKTRNIMEYLEIEPKSLKVPWAKTIPQANKRITTVRIAVARLELTPVMPILARMATRAAKTAERMA